MDDGWNKAESVPRSDVLGNVKASGSESGGFSSIEVDECPPSEGGRAAEGPIEATHIPNRDYLILQTQMAMGAALSMREANEGNIVRGLSSCNPLYPSQ